MRSDDIKELTAALLAVQESMRPANLNKVNDHFGSRYADLSEIKDSILPTLNKYGIAVTQCVALVGDRNALVTRLMHRSGQYIESVFPLPDISIGAHKFGSALTYARRYSISAIVFQVAEEDDDGNAAQGAAAKSKPPMRRQPPAQPTDENSAREETRAALGKPVTIPVPGTNEGLDYLSWGKQFVASINDAPNLAEVHAWIDANVTALGNMEIEAPKAFKHLNARIAERETALKQAA